MTRPAAILYVDDDRPNLDLFRRCFDEIFDVHLAESAEEGLSALSREDVAVLITDQRMPGTTGIELCQEARLRHPDVSRVLLTAYSDRELLLAAIHKGAVHDYVLKPWDASDLELRLRAAVELHARAAAARAAERENERLRAELAAREGEQEIVGLDGDLAPLAAALRKVARTDATVMLRGETGTGKELLARRLHLESARAKGPFVRVHCAALAESVLESELFGHEAGAFTGARGTRIGRIEQAHQGTLFLDEIGDVSQQVQLKLLRAVQEREIERVGGSRTVRVDVRFVTATHRDLEALVAEGRFREDLFHRLHVVPIVVPPLRERPGDLRPLAEWLLRDQARRLGGKALALSDDALRALAAYDWPGNVRELSNVIERAAVLADSGTTLELEDLSFDFAARPRAVARSLHDEIDQEARAELRDAMKKARGNKARAAALLGIPRTTLNDRLRKLGVD
jgi:two-component system response regulator AtoC